RRRNSPKGASWNGAWDCSSNGLSAGDDIDADIRPSSHVEHHPGWLLQLHHVPQHLYIRYRRAGAIDRGGIKDSCDGHRGRRHHPRSTGSLGRPNWNPSCLLPASALLSLHPLLWLQGIKAEIHRTTVSQISSERIGELNYFLDRPGLFIPSVGL